MERGAHWLGAGEGLGAVELLAVALGTSRSEAAGLIDAHGSLQGLIEAGPAGLLDVPGLGPVRATRLHAALALGGRVELRDPGRPVRAPSDAMAVLGPRLQGLSVEELHALFLDRRSRPLACRRLTRGTDAYTVVDPRQIYGLALRIGAASVVLAHNHPSGDPEPSRPDREVTRRVHGVGRIVGVPLLDHLVVAGEAFISLAERGVITPEPRPAPAWLAESDRGATGPRFSEKKR